jgi:mannose-6-phosphate isomerase
MTIRASVSDGPLKGQTIGQLLKQFPEQMLGKLAHRFPPISAAAEVPRCAKMLSVQVHPSKANTNLLPAGETAKSEAWVVLEAGQKAASMRALKAGTTAADLRRALTNGTVADHLASFTPKPGDAFSYRLGRSILWAATSWCSRFNRTATLRFACTTGAMLMREDRQAARTPSRSGDGLH